MVYLLWLICFPLDDIQHVGDDCDRDIVNYPEGICMCSLVLRLDARLAKWIPVRYVIS